MGLRMGVDWRRQRGRERLHTRLRWWCASGCAGGARSERWVSPEISGPPGRRSKTETLGGSPPNPSLSERVWQLRPPGLALWQRGSGVQRTGTRERASLETLRTTGATGLDMGRRPPRAGHAVALGGQETPFRLNDFLGVLARKMAESRVLSPWTLSHGGNRHPPLLGAARFPNRLIRVPGTHLPDREIEGSQPRGGLLVASGFPIRWARPCLVHRIF